MKIFKIAILAMFWASLCMAEPADIEPFLLTQPDGSTLHARLVGDEHFHVLETADGYILQKDVLGFYAYADENGNSSGIYARDPNNRSNADTQFLSKLNPETTYQKLLNEAPAEETLEYSIPKFAQPKIQRMPIPNKNLTQGDRHAIVILVQFSDVKFKNADPKKQFEEILNKEGYNEYRHEGSARDYFIKNSMGAFRPTFDVYGPITVPGTQASYGGKSSSDRNYDGARTALKQALDTLLKWNNIDFSTYDNDKDNIVDFIYMIYAGVGASSSGVIETIWPHAGYITKKMGNGPTVRRYACSNEISGKAYKSNHSTNTPNGIGTFVHEFSHVLGLPDLYDLKGENTRKTPHGWSLMGHGSYSCPTNTYNVQGCTPPYYSAFERLSVGWMTAPEELNTKGPVRLDKIDDNVAYSVTNPENPDEMFLLEYRTNKTWDAGQPGSGMLIWHIDYVASVWTGRTININGDHMYVDIEEAYPESGKTATPSDAFPGSKQVTEFNKFVFWNDNDMKIALSNITESSDKEYITFNVDMTVRSSSSALSSSSQSSSSQFSSSSTATSSSSNSPELSSSSETSSSSSLSSSSSAQSSSSNDSSSSAISSSSTSSSSSILSSSAISSSSTAISSSSNNPELSSSSVASSSSEQSSSSATSSSSIAPKSSSSEQESSSSTEISSSSSDVESSSSSDYPVFAATGASPYQAKVTAQNGMIHVFTPMQGTKNIRIFTPNGQLLSENIMDGTEYFFPLPRHFGKQNVVLSVSQGKKILFMGMIRNKN